MLLILFLTLVILQAADVYLTNRILSIGGKELNPIVRRLMLRIGTVKAFIVFKAVIVAAVVVGLFIAPEVPLLIVLVGLDLIYMYVVYRNYREYREQNIEGH
ncbi:hypothetical protein CMI37_36815 [Candidatus Pacearchaeota archaeon]|nr:hypothetical protein [Candidatus Pacearchaeota archaeon]|tara:strand:- start:4335 stop:4640 length:306 start_codon:yes stop_codon:yes gene_type:complete